MSSKTNIFYNRERFQSVLDWAKKNDVVPEESILRVSQPLKNGNGRLSFDIKNGRKNEMDVTLDRNDLFIPNGFMVGIAFEKTDSFGNPLGSAPLHTYAPAAGSNTPVGFKTRDIEALYNGLMTIKFGQTVVNSSFPMLNFKHVPAVQPELSGTGTLGMQAEFDMMDALYPLAPKYYIQGTEDIKIDINFNGVDADFTVCEAATPTQASATYTPHVYLVMTGVLVKGAADKAKNNPLSL